jgi:hypothetical protein
MDVISEANRCKIDVKISKVYQLGFTKQKVPENLVYPGLCFSAGREGFEPGTYGLRIGFLTCPPRSTANILFIISNSSLE